MAKTREDKQIEKIKEIMGQFLELQAKAVVEHKLLITPVLRVGNSGIVPDIDFVIPSAQQIELAKKRLEARNLTKIETISKIN